MSTCAVCGEDVTDATHNTASCMESYFDMTQCASREKGEEENDHKQKQEEKEEEEGEEYACSLCGKDLQRANFAARVRHIKECSSTNQTLPISANSVLNYVSIPTGRKRSLHADINKSNVSAWKSLLNGNAPKKKQRQKQAQKPPPSAEMTKKRQRVPPPYKRIHGTKFLVDAFGWKKNIGCTAYFLSHFHSDHYGGLAKSFSWGHIFCSAITAALVQESIGVSPRFMTALPLNQTVVIDGCGVTLLDANHCPGAVMFLFQPQLKQMEASQDPRARFPVHLHVGDFRYVSSMREDPFLQAILAADSRQFIDKLYLDTTYCDPKHVFPPQNESIAYCVDQIRRRLVSPISMSASILKQWTHQDIAAVDGDKKKKDQTQFVIGSYTLGKEKVMLAIAQQLGLKIGVPASYYHKLERLEIKNIAEFFTTDLDSSRVHVLPIFQVTYDGLAAHRKKLGKSQYPIMGFRPTGWAGNVPKQRSKRTITVHDVPYSEHSSFTELCEFLRFVKARTIVPTVSPATSQQQVQLLQSYITK